MSEGNRSLDQHLVDRFSPHLAELRGVLAAVAVAVLAEGP